MADLAGLALPRMTDQPGCLGGMVLVDPVSSAFHAVTFWERGEDLVTSGALARTVTSDVCEQIGASLSDVVVQVVDVVALDVLRLAEAIGVVRLAEAIDCTGVPFPLVRPG
jgi:hypothetical protein